MRKARFWGLLWAFFISELQTVVKSAEVKFTLQEGQALSVSCPFNVWKYRISRKAWQRLTDGGGYQTLISTKGASEEPNEVKVGRYILEEYPIDGILQVRMTNLQVADSGLYQCVIYQPSKHPIVLFHPVRLEVTKGYSSTFPSDNRPFQILNQTSTISPITTKTRNKLHTNNWTETRLLPMTTSSPSSIGFTVNPTQKTDAIGVSLISIVLLLVCGILSKSLVFTVLLVVTQRSFGS